MYKLLQGNAGIPTFILEPRRIGKFPIARLGRSNIGDFTICTNVDNNKTWIHLMNGIYLPWYGLILP